MKLRGDFGVAKHSPSLTRSALAMLPLFVGFYLLALTVALALVAAPVLEFLLADRVHPQLLLASVYASFYLARSQGISRSQEFSADRLAARVTAPHTAARALACLMPANAAFEHYRTYEYAPVLQAGRRPPYIAGFQAMLASSMMTGDGRRSTDVALGAVVGSRFDSHPSPFDRIRALGVDPDDVATRPWP